MAIPCPCCKATNEIGPNCRRCKADLSLLFAIESQREASLETARELIRQEQISAALAELDRAEKMRQGRDILRLRAAAWLLRRDFHKAIAAYHASEAAPG